MPKTLGILGGMGPLATANFYRLLVKGFNSAGIYEDGDFPKMIMLTLPMQEFDHRGAREEDKDTVKQNVLSGLEWLYYAGADVVAIPCNTVHEFLSGDKSLVNIVDETLKLCKPGRVGVLCSNQAREAKLYERSGHDVTYYPMQDHVDSVIRSAQYGAYCDIGPMMNAEFSKCSSIVLGCTELSLCHISLVGTKHIVDSTTALANATVARFL